MQKKKPTPIAKTPSNDDVNHPAHYNAGNIEVIEAIEDWGLDYHKGNAVKYIARAGKKTADPRKDLQKAIWYLNRAIELDTAKEFGQRAPKPDNTPITRAR